MLDPANIPPVTASELVARFILSGSHIRSADRSIKPDAFMPYRYTELSVTRHTAATDDEIWQVGRGVAVQTQKILHGRADVLVSKFVTNDLSVVAVPLSDNPNHADAIGWPAEKHEQKIIALRIADGIHSIDPR